MFATARFSLFEVLDVVAMNGPGLGHGALQLIGGDIIDAHGGADVTKDERYTLLTMAVFHSIREPLDMVVRVRSQVVLI